MDVFVIFPKSKMQKVVAVKGCIVRHPTVFRVFHFSSVKKWPNPP